VRLIFRIAREGDGSSGTMGVKSVAAHLNANRIRTRNGGRWGVGAVHKVLTRTTYIGRHRFNTRFWKTRERKPEADVVEMVVPPIIDVAEFEAVQTLLKTRSPALSAPRTVSGPTLLTGICFCASCGMAMTLRTGKGGPSRYYTLICHNAIPRVSRMHPGKKTGFLGPPNDSLPRRLGPIDQGPTRTEPPEQQSRIGRVDFGVAFRFGKSIPAGRAAD
jgi:hypothetical protein